MSQGEEETRELYSTTDFYTTAVLICKEYEIVKVTREKKDSKVRRFHFESTDELQDTIMKYMNGQLEGNLRKFRNSIETVRDLVHSG